MSITFLEWMVLLIIFLFSLPFFLIFLILKGISHNASKTHKYKINKKISSQLQYRGNSYEIIKKQNLPKKVERSVRAQIIDSKKFQTSKDKKKRLNFENIICNKCGALFEEKSYKCNYCGSELMIQKTNKSKRYKFKPLNGDTELERYINHMPEIQQKFLHLRYGLGRESMHTHHEISKKLGLSIEELIDIERVSIKQIKLRFNEISF